jgi:hypothetical protein
VAPKAFVHTTQQPMFFETENFGRFLQLLTYSEIKKRAEFAKGAIVCHKKNTDCHTLNAHTLFSHFENASIASVEV